MESVLAGATGVREWELWSTTARLVVGDPATLDAAEELVRAELAEIELAASRFRPDSEISRLGAGTTRISPLLAGLVREALEAARLTGGAVDPTVGRALVDLGYDRDITLIERDGRTVAVVRPAAGWRHVQLHDQVLTLTPGLRLDLGATAKAVAADRCAALVAHQLGVGVLVALGGDIATAGREPDGGWWVRVQDVPEDPAERIGLPSGCGLATSSTMHRVWTRGGRRLHHIVDPATGAPAPTTWRSVTVAAPTCAEANTLSTATIVMGEAGLDWLRGRGVPARLVDARGRVHHLGAWPTEVAA
jgi:thiamine biosynthesis lipoprotein